MLAVPKLLLLLLSLFLILNVEACPRPADPKPDIYDVVFPEIDTEDPRCCHEIEQNYCFSLANLSPLQRQPECPKKITTFTLFTRSTPSGVTISEDNVPLAFSNNRLTVLIVHGYFESFNPKYQELKDELLKKNNYNVIVVDWKIGAGRNIIQSLSNSYIMGEYLGILVNFLRKQSGSNPYFWCIGHGFGAHICGKTRIRAITILDRITAVDPFLNGLLRDNATRVDVIHTDSVWGQENAPLGHVDFYPNGGTGQPGCTAVIPTHDFNSPETRRKIGNEGLTCNHRRALEYMIHSINSPLCYVATHKCTDDKNIPYFCARIPSNEQKGYMGHDAINYRYQGILYFEVDNTSPYCSVGTSTC